MKAKKAMPMKKANSKDAMISMKKPVGTMKKGMMSKKNC